MKKPYERPKVVEFGTVEDLTKETGDVKCKGSFDAFDFIGEQDTRYEVYDEPSEAPPGCL